MTPFRENSDYNRQDERGEAEALYQRQGAIEDFVEGKGQADTLLDMLEEQGIDAAAYADRVHAEVEAVIDSGIVYISNDAGLLIPSGMVL
ncbi:MAG: hypothetical protein AAFN38_21715 [Cyanobacteria bacterium J06560_5]